MRRTLSIISGLIFTLIGTELMAAEKPNILFLFADDHSYDSTGLMSNGYVQTPAIDSIASQGVYFQRAYNMGAWSGPVCLASRTMLNTGKSLWNAKRLLDTKQLPEHVSWSQRLQKAGYTTFFAGKWHVNGYDPRQLFDHTGTIRPGMPATKGDSNRPIQGQNDTWSPSDSKLEGYWKGGKHWSEVTADETIDFLKQRGSADDNRPFFAYVAFNAPHDPRQSPQKYLDLYPLKSVPLPPSFMPSYPYTKKIGIWDIRAETLAPRPRTELAIKTHRREYYALISHMDAQISRILDELKQQGMSDNTLIIYTADNGLSLGNHSFMAKQSMYDHSLASPLIISGPHIPKGVQSTQRIYVQDIMPTTLEVAGLKRSDFTDVDFDSLLPLMKSPAPAHSAPIYGAFMNFSRCIIRGNWKLIYYPKAQKQRLFNLGEDPHELFDVADDPANQAIVQELTKALAELQNELGDPLVPTAPATATEHSDESTI
jgi:choline-sulfatase